MHLPNESEELRRVNESLRNEIRSLPLVTQELEALRKSTILHSHHIQIVSDLDYIKTQAVEESDNLRRINESLRTELSALAQTNLNLQADIKCLVSKITEHKETIKHLTAQNEGFRSAAEGAERDYVKAKVRVNLLSSSLTRLLDGSFTEEEFQNICHNLPHTMGPDARERFEKGCRQLQNKLFGPKHIDAIPSQSVSISQHQCPNCFGHNWTRTMRNSSKGATRLIYKCIDCGTVY